MLLLFFLGDSLILAMEAVVPHNEDIQKISLITNQVMFDGRSLGSEVLLNTKESCSVSAEELPSVFQGFDKDLVLFLSQFLKLETLVSFSQVDHFSREFLYRPKLQHFLNAAAYTLPRNNTYSLAKLLKKITNDERFLYGAVYAENSQNLRPTNEEIKLFENKNINIIMECLNRSKSMHYSLTFRQLGGHEYRDEIARRRGEDLNLGVFHEVKAMILSTRYDPVIMYGSATVLSALLMTVFYDFYANYHQSHYRYGLYTDHNNCVIYYAKAPSILGGYHLQKTIPLCPQNTYQEKMFKTSENMWANGQILKGQVMRTMLLVDVSVFGILFTLFKFYMLFFDL